MDAFLVGVLAGLAIAVPVGAVGVLIVERAARDGFRSGLAAGLGAASADVTYAVLAASAGGAIAAAVGPRHRAVSLVGAAILVLLAARMFRRGARERGREPASVARVPPAPRGHLRTWASFYALTLANPMTVVYFTVLATSLARRSPTSYVAFVAGAGLASAAWQTLLAGVAAALGRRMSPAVRTATTWTGATLVLLFAVRTAIG